MNLATVVERSPDITLVLGADGVIYYCSRAVATLLGRSSEPLVGHAFAALMHLEDQSAWASCLRRATAGGLPPTVLVRLSHVHGAWVDVEVRALDLADEPEVRGVVVLVRDARRRRAEEEDLRQLALQDPLTRLANRALFADHVERALAEETGLIRPIGRLVLERACRQAEA